jgi:integrase
MNSDPLIDRFAQELTRMRRSPRTIRNRRQIVGQFARFLTDRDRTLLDADRGDVLDFLAQYREPETVGTYRGALSVFYEWAVDEALIAREPTRRMPTVVRDKVDPNPIPDELLRDVLADACPQDRKIIVLGRFAGLRAAEIATAHRAYLKPGNRGQHVVRLRGKGNRWRELPAHRLVVDVFRAETGYLFESPKYPGHPVLPETIGQRMSDLLPGDHTCHDLRAAFATAAYWQNGRDLALVQRWLGHQSPATTLRYVLMDHDFAAMERMNLDGDWWAAA